MPRSNSSASSRSSRSSRTTRSSGSVVTVKSTDVHLPRKCRALDLVLFFAGAPPSRIKHLRRDVIITEAEYDAEDGKSSKSRDTSYTRREIKTQWHFVASRYYALDVSEEDDGDNESGKRGSSAGSGPRRRSAGGGRNQRRANARRRGGRDDDSVDSSSEESSDASDEEVDAGDYGGNPGYNMPPPPPPQPGPPPGPGPHYFHPQARPWPPQPQHQPFHPGGPPAPPPQDGAAPFIQIR